MKFLKLFALVLALITTPAFADARLAQSKTCLNCHSVDKAIYGPAYKQVAQRYRATQGAELIVATKIRTGSKWSWGTKVMPPQPVSEAEALALAKWIIELK